MHIVDKIKSAFSSNKAPKWRPDVAYNVGDMIRYKGKTYTALIANTSTPAMTPDMDATTWSLTTKDKTKEKKTKISRWREGTMYNAGDKVRYKGKVYTALVAGSGTMTPDMDATMWSMALKSDHTHRMDGTHDHVDSDTSSTTSMTSSSSSSSSAHVAGPSAPVAPVTDPTLSRPPFTSGGAAYPDY